MSEVDACNDDPNVGEGDSSTREGNVGERDPGAPGGRDYDDRDEATDEDLDGAAKEDGDRGDDGEDEVFIEEGENQEEAHEGDGQDDSEYVGDVCPNLRRVSKWTSARVGRGC